MKTNVLYPNLSYRIIGICFAIHNQLGDIHQEKVYQNALEEILKENRLIYQREVYVPILFKDKKVGKYFVDFIIDDKILLELKAQRIFQRKYFDQILKYMSMLQLRLGIIINFKSEKLWYKRVVLPDKYLKKH